jgi:hypothetical protein
MRPIPGAATAIVFILLVGCASAAPEHLYIAPTAETVFTTTAEIGSVPGQIIAIENRSTVPITVYSVTLRECENVRPQCSVPRRLNLHIAPHGKETLVRVEPANPRTGFRFRYSYGWRADSSSIAALGALASAGDTLARNRLAAISREEAHRRAAVGVKDLDLTPAEVNALADQATSLRATPDSLTIQSGGRVTLDTIHVLLIGPQGETLGRIRAFQWRLASGAVSAIRPDTIAGVRAGRAVLELRLPDNVLPGKPALHTPILIPIIVRE